VTSTAGATGGTDEHAAIKPEHRRSQLAKSDTSGMEWPAPLTVREVADELECSEDDIRALIRDGELQTVACGIRPRLVPRHQLDDYLRRSSVERSARAQADRE
jgi:excisionase family DNA binding protein